MSESPEIGGEGEKIPFARFKFDDMDVFSTKDNTLIFTHDEAYEKYDHIFIMNEDFEQSQEGCFVWREMVDNFDDVVQFMIDADFMWFERDEPVPLDVEQHDKFLARFMAKQILEETAELTPRQEGRIKWLAHLLENNLINWADEGDIWL